ncbi:pilus assembly protein PilM [Kordiimonas sp. SCSIO 12603]|uniref:pilus assembly protein PilM n=1 Tax=Kordiimonas sp. SCSIO 12603 TaxID=2829596 RepID=UPI00210491C3|nr:pilus assembly protein PilM [Kordiimonas sp. SCSIO 12603]UTW58734.1 pilus assembly protein PilM [Kordiimonas sp. SCSIO 12603]
MIGFWTPVFNFIQKFFEILGAWLEHVAPQKLRPFLKLSGPAEALIIENLHDLKKSLSKLDKSIPLHLTLAGKAVLTKTIYLPTKAGSELDKAVRMEAARVMPLQLSGLKIAYRELEKDRNEEESIAVIVAAIRHVFLDDVIDAIDRGQITLAEIDINTEVGALPLRLSAVVRRSYLKVFFVSTALVMSAMFVSFIPTIYIDRLEAEDLVVSKAIRTARKNSVKVTELQRQMQTMHNLSSAVRIEKTKSQTLALLKLLTELAPDDVTIVNFRIDGSRVYLNGKSQEPAEWAIALETNDFIENVSLTNVLELDEGQRRRFELSFQVIWQDLNQGAQNG